MALHSAKPVNKVEINGRTVLDLTQDTVTPATLGKGQTAHDKSGAVITGTMEAGSSKEEQEKSITITANGSYTIEPDDGKTLSKVTATVNVPDSGGGTTPIASDDITFYDYDGTVVAAWSAEELSSKTELPAYPSHDGLVCQGWNWTLEELKSSGRKRIPVGALYATDDNKTRIYIELQEGRTSPMLGCCPKGSVTVDWGDGSATETLTGTRVVSVKWTSTHSYSAPGKYIITLSMSEGGLLGFAGSPSTNSFGYILRQAKTADVRNVSYLSAVKRIECGDYVTNIGGSAFNSCYGLETISVPRSVKTISNGAFYNARSLKAFIAGDVGLLNPTDQSSASSQFAYCNNLAVASFRSSVANNAPVNVYNSCALLANAFIHDGTTKIDGYAFYGNYVMTHLEFPSSILFIGSNSFANCYGMRIYDFSRSVSIPAIASNSFSNIPSDCEIRVPSALADDWKSDTNWSSLATHIVAV